MDEIVASELVGGVEALRVAGVIDPNGADGLLRQLDDARRAQVDASRARLSGVQPLDPEPTNLIRGVLVPVVPLVDVDAITLVLLTLELWEQDVHLMAACLQTQRTQELRSCWQRTA